MLNLPALATGPFQRRADGIGRLTFFLFKLQRSAPHDRQIYHARSDEAGQASGKLELRSQKSEVAAVRRNPLHFSLLASHF
jgi:hypothetical protein